jgi:hypothetical protein
MLKNYSTRCHYSIHITAGHGRAMKRAAASRITQMRNITFLKRLTYIKSF